MTKARKTTAFLCLTLMSWFPLQAQSIITGGNVSGEWTKSGSPYLILDHITVLPDSVLRIGPGVLVEFQGNFGLTVKGVLLARGVPGDSVCFTVSDTTGFSDTTMAWGGWGGIYFNDGLSGGSSLMDHCVVCFGKANGAGDDDRQGGGICARRYSSLVIRDCRVHHNLARTDGGGISVRDRAQVSIERCDISYNSAYRNGGGIDLGNYCEALVRNNRIHHNTAILKKIVPPYISFSGSGGGIYASECDPMVTGNFICNNNAVSGGGIYESSPGIVIAGNVICNNNGPGIFNGHTLGEGKYINNTIVGNTRAGGIVSNSWRLLITGDILWNNINNTNPGVQIETDYGTPEVSYCNIQDGFTGTGNINAFPFFREPTPGAGWSFDAQKADWTLQDISPCIDSGQPDTTGLGLEPEDIGGCPRIAGNRIEMGAYEKLVPMLGAEEDHETPVIVKVFPNPTAGPVTFAFYKLLEGNFYLFSVKGQVVIIDHINMDKDRTFDLAAFPPGTYFWRIDDASGTYQGKIFLER